MLKKLIFLSVWVFTLLLMLALQGSSLKCYQCNTFFNETCDKIDSEEDKEFLLPCKESAIICRTQYHSFKTEKRVIRDCGMTRHKRPCYSGVISSDLKSLTCECDKDGCNAAMNVKAEPELIKLASIVLISLYLLR